LNPDSSLFKKLQDLSEREKLLGGKFTLENRRKFGIIAQKMRGGNRGVSRSFSRGVEFF